MKGVDTLKLFFSLVVVWIHTGVGNLGGLTRWAVPFFFLMSGFFLFGKLFNNPETDQRSGILMSWLKKILRHYLIWSIIFLPFAIIGFQHDSITPLKAILVYLRNLVLVGENYLSWPLWYLLGLLWSGVIIWIANKLRIPFWALCLLAVLLFLTPLLLHLEENDIYLRFFKTTRNGLFLGFPVMVLGGLLRRIIPPKENWEPGSWQEKTALNFRFLSIHIYLSHIIWGFERGLMFWAITCAISIVTGLLIQPCNTLVKFLYGRTYRT